MERKIIISKRFRNNSRKIYYYLLNNFPASTAYNFPLRLEKRIEFIGENSTVGKSSGKNKHVRSMLFFHITKSSTGIKMTLSKFYASLICGKIQQKDLIENKY